MASLEKPDTTVGSRLPYLSPSSINMWLKDPQEFYRCYMCRTPRMPQTLPMAVGSAFDAYIKAYLSNQSYDKLFEQSVEPQNRDYVRSIGKEIFLDYKKVGALDGLVNAINAISSSGIRVMDKVRGTLNGVPLLGKPDLVYGSTVLDWKVNGYLSKHGASPKPGYVLTYPDRKMHRDTLLVDGVNAACSEIMGTDWGIQLVIYGLLCDCEVAEISQLCYRRRMLRVAVHRYAVPQSGPWYDYVHGAVTQLWDRVCGNGHFFRNLDVDESNKLCARLEAEASVLQEDSFAQMVGRG